MSRHADTQQRIELYQVSPVLDSLGIASTAVICSDKPDIIIPDHDGKRIGVELVECRPSAIGNRKGQTMAMVSNRIDRVCERYRQILVARGEEHTHVSLSFTDEAHRLELGITDREFQERVLEEIERHIKYNAVYKNRHRNIDEYLRLHKAGCFRYKYISDYRANTFLHNTFVSPIYAYCVAQVEPNHILYAIAKKEGKLQEYRQNPKNADIEEYWLVVNVPKEERCDFDYLKPFDIDSQYARIYLTQWSEMKRIK